MARGARGWLGELAEVVQALLADPVLLAPALLVIVLAIAGAYVVLHFM